MTNHFKLTWTRIVFKTTYVLQKSETNFIFKVFIDSKIYLYISR